MAERAPVINESQMVHDEFISIPEVDRVYVEYPDSARSTLNVVVVVPDSNPDVLDKVVAAEAELLSAFPWLNIDFDVIFRLGRPVNDLVSPRGTLLFSR